MNDSGVRTTETTVGCSWNDGEGFGNADDKLRRTVPSRDDWRWITDTTKTYVPVHVFTHMHFQRAEDTGLDDIGGVML